MTHIQSRREFVQQLSIGAFVAGGLSLTPRQIRAESSPNEKLNIACVGTQNRASSNINGVHNQNIVAYCDVDANNLAKRIGGNSNLRGYKDFRKMLEKEEKNIDAVVVSTPDHIHAPATAMALKMKKHAYCEKPLTHTVAEARLVAELAKENGCVTQMGTQIHAGDNYRRVVELVQSGAIGSITEAHVWCNKGWSDGRFKFGKPAPEHLDWNLWLGPAKKIPYSEGVHPFNWRRFWDFGSGTLGDMGCHIMDLAFWALQLRHPTTISAEGPEVHEVGCPGWVKIDYQFPARGDMGPVHVTWQDGGKRPQVLNTIKKEGGPDLNKWGIGVVFIGEKGMLAANYGSRHLLPLEKFKDFKAPAPTIPNSIGHHNEWIQACKSGGETTCNFDYAGALTETVLLGTVAYRSGAKLEWDAKNLKVTNDESANDFVSKEYRKGWELPKLG